MPSAPAPTAPEPELEMIRLAAVPEQYGFYRWGNVAINVWNAPPSEASVACIADLTEQSSRTFPEGISSVHWLTPDAGVPSRSARAGLRAISVQHDEHIKCVAAVLDGGGFWASAVRAALNGIVMTADVKFVPRLYGNLDGLLDWLPEAHHRATGVRVRGGALRTRILEALQDTVPNHSGS